MMKKNIFIIILLGILLTVSIAGCGSHPTNEEDGTEQSATSELAIAEQAEETDAFTVSSEVINAELYSNLIQIGDTVISEPPTYADFISAGAVFTNEDMTEDYLINLGEGKTANMQIGNTIIQLSMTNNGEDICSLKNADAAYIVSTKGPDVFYPMGIKVGDTLAELTEKWGQPSVDSSKIMDKVLTYVYMEYPVELSRVHSNGGSQTVSATGFKYTVSIDRDTAQITNIQCQWVNKTATGTYTDISEEVTYMNGDVYTLSYRLPYEISQNAITIGGKAMSVYIIDDIPYVIVLDANLSGIGFVAGLSEEDFANTINEEYASVRYEIESIQTDGTEGTAIGYLYSDAAIECKAVFMNETHQYTSYESMIIPWDENGTVSEAAGAEFKAIMSDFIDSIKVS